MTLPPQDPFGSQPSGGGGGPQWGGPPPQGPGGPSPYGQPGPQWQQSWAPPPNKGGKGKWILVGLALLAVIAVSVVGTVLVLRPDTNGGKSPNNGDGTSEFASANDTGPANIITEEPTCEAWGKIARDMNAAVPEWNTVDYKVPRANWTPELRTVFEKQGSALTTAITNVANIAKKTPHRVMRELYGQFSAYAQAVIDSIPNYSPTDNEIVATLNQFSAVLNRVCEAINYRAAQQTAPLISAPAPPSDVQTTASDDGRVPERFLSGSDSDCTNWMSITEDFDNGSRAWRDIDSKISATEWTPDQRAVMDAVGPVMETYADEMERLGRGSGNPVWEDFAVLAAQYMRAYVQSIPTYTVNVGYMASVSTRVAYAINWACKAES